MKLLVTLAALLLAGCSVEVAHETENKSQSESLSIFEKSKTVVAVGILEAPETSTETRHTDSATPAVQRSQTIVKVVVPESSREVVISEPSTTVTRSPDQSIQVTGSGNTVILGDVNVHIHRHEHVHVYQPQKPASVKVDIRVEVGDRLSERERRRRMVERRIARAFPRYRD